MATCKGGPLDGEVREANFLIARFEWVTVDGTTHIYRLGLEGLKLAWLYGGIVGTPASLAC